MLFLLCTLIVVVVNSGPVFAAPSEENNSSCVLPPIPRHGIYNIPHYDGPVVPGNLVDAYTVLAFSCADEDYQLIPDNPYSLCKEDNTWSTLPECHKMCDMPNSITVDFECTGAKSEKIKCTAKMPQGSHITSRCKDGHVSAKYIEDLTCHEGAWDSNIPTCKAGRRPSAKHRKARNSYKYFSVHM